VGLSYEKLIGSTLWVVFLLLGIRPICGQSSTPKRAPIQARISYTGDLFGYARLPNEQLSSQHACPADDTDANDLGKSLISVLGKPPVKGIVLGVGNDFAPELFSRLIDPSRGGDSKDGYVWDYVSHDPQWITLHAAQSHQDLLDDLAEGNGRIPMDNVGCFLSWAGYSAIVPGKQDFHYGAEYLRQVARFLASRPAAGPFRPVQVLGANLVIQTTVNKAAKRIPFRDKPHPPYSDDAGDLTSDIKDGDIVLPWLRQITIGHVPSNGEVSICPVVDQIKHGRIVRDPDHADLYHCTVLVSNRVDAKGTSIYSVPYSDPQTFLTPNNDYWLCVTHVYHPRDPHDQRPYCAHFSVYSPFFMYPNPIPRPGLATWPRRGMTTASGGPTSDGGYLDPRPYTVVKDAVSGTETAIFGVVDPQIGEHVGQLNEQWVNPDRHRSTKVTAIDPVIALRQLLQYFAEDHPQFAGLKILLAEMPSYEAERIAIAMKGEFNLIIAQAQREYATPAKQETLSVPASPSDEPLKQTAIWRAPTFIAAPVPFYDGISRKNIKLTTGSSYITEVVLASATISKQDNCPAADTDCEEHWTLNNTIAKEVLPNSQHLLFADVSFANAISGALSTTHYGLGAGGTSVDQFKLLTLELMKIATNSDVAMLQKRDIFEPIVRSAPNALDLQQALDRIFWKDDFAVRVLVRGDVLKSILAKSQQFDAEDKNSLSVLQEQRRGVIYLGILHDPVTDQYFVRGQALDPTEMYSVAASDYIAVGDTGYSDLLTPAVGQPLNPLSFSSFSYVSAIVCRHIADTVSGFHGAPCKGARRSDEYFDALNQEPFDTTKGFTPGQHFRTWLRFQKRRPSLYQGQSSLEKAVQQFPSWSFSLSKMSFGFIMNQHNNGTEKNLAALFAGVPVSQVNAPNTNTTSFDFSFRLQRDSRSQSTFAQGDAAYTRQLTRQSDALNSDLAAQLKNLLAVESGILPRIFPRSKEIPDLKVLLSGRLETNFAPPLTSFKLSTSPPSLLKQTTARPKNVLAKIGLRFDNEKSYIESGYEIGEALGSPLAFVFNPGSAQEVTCSATSAQKATSLGTCVAANSTPPTGFISATSRFREVTRSLFQNGLFLNFRLNVPLPFNDNLTYTMENRGELFFNHRGNVSVDTKFQSDWTQSLTVPLVGNFSLLPKFEMFFYENKVDEHFFYAVQPSISLQYAFDWHRGLPWWKSMIYKKPATRSGTAAATGK